MNAVKFCQVGFVKILTPTILVIFYPIQEIGTSLFYDEAEVKLANSTLTAKKVQFDAFRTKDRAPPGFRVRKLFVRHINARCRS